MISPPCQGVAGGGNLSGKSIMLTTVPGSPINRSFRILFDLLSRLDFAVVDPCQQFVLVEIGFASLTTAGDFA